MRILAMMLLLAAPNAQGCEEEAPMPESIQQVRQRHETRLMAIPGVVSVGVGRDERGKAVIVVGLEGERPESERQIPEWLDGYEVHRQVVGKVTAR